MKFYEKVMLMRCLVLKCSFVKMQYYFYFLQENVHMVIEEWQYIKCITISQYLKHSIARIITLQMKISNKYLSK